MSGETMGLGVVSETSRGNTSKLFAVAAVVGGIAFGGISALLDDGIKGCIPDGDGGVNIVKDDGTVVNSRAWTVSDDGETCYASNGGNAAPERIPVLK